MYKFHKDNISGEWNVFDAHEYFVCAFKTAKQAFDFCEYMNGLEGACDE